jgi:uncharacterized protein
MAKIKQSQSDSMMKKMIFKTWNAYTKATILILVLCANSLCAQNGDNSLLWEITGSELDKPSYLFGTFHLLNDGFLQSKPEVLNRFEKAEQVLVEVEIDSSKMQQLAMMTLMQGDLISNYLTEKEAEQISEILSATLGVSLAQVDMLKPMALMATLSMIHNQMILGEDLTGYKGIPIDQWFALNGRKHEKNVVPLESLEEQMHLLFNTTSNEEQTAQLVSYLQNEEESFELIRTLFDCYVTENLRCLQQIGDEMYDVMPGMTAFLDERNLNWMENIPGLIADKSTFIAVGALHLTGKKGLIELLRKEGYRVEPILTNP